MSFLLVEGDVALLLDAGSGVGRLLDPALVRLTAPCARLEVVLTHYHLDHVIGLSYLPGVWQRRPVAIHAPAPPLVEGTPEALERLIGPPLFPHPLSRLPFEVTVTAYRAGPLAIGGLTVAARAQRHPGGSVGLRVGDALAYATDTVADEATVEFARGVGLLLHEVWLSDEEAEGEDPARGGHSAAGAVADLARRAGVGRLMPVHHHPKRSAAELATIAAGMATRAGLTVELPVEGQIYSLD